MGGLDTPTSGTVVVRGEELAKKNDEQLTIFRRRNIGFIFQNYNLVPILNVYENIVLPVELDGDTVDQKFLDEIVHLLGLEDKLKNMPEIFLFRCWIWRVCRRRKLSIFKQNRFFRMSKFRRSVYKFGL